MPKKILFVVVASRHHVDRQIEIWVVTPKRSSFFQAVSGLSTRHSRRLRWCSRARLSTSQSSSWERTIGRRFSTFSAIACWKLEQLAPSIMRDSCSATRSRRSSAAWRRVPRSNCQPQKIARRDANGVCGVGALIVQMRQQSILGVLNPHRVNERTRACFHRVR